MKMGSNRRDDYEGEPAPSSIPACQVCGAPARRFNARYCAVCGYELFKDYCPTDALRASYRQFEITGATAAAAPKPKVREQRWDSQRDLRRGRKFGERIFSVSSCPSLAFATYALVPYLGIIFCLPAIIIGCAGLMRADVRANGRSRFRYLESRRTSIIGIILGVVILGIQLFLWWLLQKIPDWSQP